MLNTHHRRDATVELSASASAVCIGFNGTSQGKVFVGECVLFSFAISRCIEAVSQYMGA